MEKVIKSYLEKKKTYSGWSIEFVAITVEDFQSYCKASLCNMLQ